MLAQLYRSWLLFWMSLGMLADYYWLDFMERFRSPEAHKRALLRASTRWGRGLLRTALRLHGLIIKVGQFLSARADVLPESFTKELAALQDAVPPAPYALIRQRVEEELGAPLSSVFSEFEEEALASASLGQVHRAKLHDGQTVAVKVLRPGIERIVAIDLAAVRRLARFFERRTKFGQRLHLQALVDEFETITYQEMDYRLEAENIRRFRKQFAGVEGILVPYPVDNIVTHRVLAMEFMAGFKLTDRERLVAWGLDPVVLAARLVDSYLKQLLIDGFVHVDPHPGNLLVNQSGDLIFVDFGMMGTIAPEDRQGFADLAHALLTRDADAAVRALDGLGFLRHKGLNDPLRRAVSYVLEHLSDDKLQPGPEFDRFVDELRDWMDQDPVQFPAKYLYIARALGLMTGIAATLDPQIDWVAILKERALPLLDTFRAGRDAAAAGEQEKPWFDWRAKLSEWFGPTAPLVADVVLTQIKETGLSMVRVPVLVERTLAKMAAGAFQVQTDLSPLTERMELQQRAMNRLTWALLGGAAGIAGAVLRVGGFNVEATLTWCGSVVVLLLMLWSMLSDSNAVDRRRGPHSTIRKRS